MKLILKYLIVSLCLLFSQEKLFYLKYEKNENTIYKNQIFRVNLSLLSFGDKILNIKSDMSNYRGIKVYNGSLRWKKNKKNKFNAFLYLKALSSNIKLPDINLTIVGDKNKFYQNLKGESIHAKKLNWIGNASHLLSSSFEVLSHETNLYDETRNMITIKIKAKDTNIKDMHIQGNEILDQNITNIRRRIPYVTAEYYAIIPNYINEFKFNYLDIKSNEFKTISLNATTNKATNFLIQDISPDIKTYDKYKLLLLFSLIALTLFMAYYRKKTSYLILTLILILILVKSFLIQTKATISEGSRFRVLPIDTSTVFYISEKDREVVVLNKTGDYIKVQITNKVGWVDKKNIINN